MADPRRRHPQDRGGEWFVDTTCIDCDVARQLAPGLIEEDAGGLSYFVREPLSPTDVRDAWRALLACPSGSIGAPRTQSPPAAIFPFPIVKDVFLAGYHSPDSFGAHSYLVMGRGTNLMVDSPRFVPPLVHAIEQAGGLRHILLTHRDDVADAEAYAKRFGARVWIHAQDADAAPFATDVFQQETEISPGLVAIPFPGHTRGSALFLLDDEYLFTGDAVAWSRRQRSLTAFRDATWYSWSILTESMRGLANRSFSWVLPGHGSWGSAPKPQMRAHLLALVKEMEAAPRQGEW